MVRKLSRVVAAGFGALTLLAGAAVYAHDAPLSVNEGPVSPNHEVAPSNSQPALGRSRQVTPPREIRGSGDSGSYEVQTPSSVDESAPWLTGQPRR